MSSKIIKLLLITLFSISMTNIAKANLIVGDLYADESGVQWQYVGSYDLTDGPDIFFNNNITPYNGIDAAILNFGALSGIQEYALSSNVVADYSDINDFIVNFEAWYDTFDGGNLAIPVGISSMSQSAVANKFGDEFYGTIGDISAFVYDRAFQGDYINHVFKSVAVPEPSSIAIFGLAIIAFSVRRFKN
jgi:hypothetical protein